MRLCNVDTSPASNATKTNTCFVGVKVCETPVTCNNIKMSHAFIIIWPALTTNNCRAVVPISSEVGWYFVQLHNNNLHENVQSDAVMYVYQRRDGFVGTGRCTVYCTKRLWWWGRDPKTCLSTGANEHPCCLLLMPDNSVWQ